jgi:hypothetical protein
METGAIGLRRQTAVRRADFSLKKFPEVAG